MRKVALIVAVLFVAGMIALAADIPAGKETIKFETKMGTVTFPHKAHAEKVGKCTECHHTTKEGEAVKPCSACHDAKEAKDKAPKLQDAVHKMCKGCHEKTVAAGKKAPSKDCKSCHVKA